jgi:DNA repair protein RecO (recombination protein O)
MPTYPKRVLILSKTKLKESDLIFTLLAYEGSQIRALAKGIRNPKAKMGGTLELFSEVDLLLAQGRNLDIITEAQTVHSHDGCRRDLEHSSAASVICEQLAKLSLEEQPQDRLFPMSCAALSAIDRTEAAYCPFLVAAFMMKTLSLLGYRPELDHCLRCGAPRDAFAREDISFSWTQGGVLCKDCAPIALNPVMNPLLIGWLKTLIYSTFDELLKMEDGPALAGELLRFSERWLLENTEISLKSLKFLLQYTL